MVSRCTLPENDLRCRNCQHWGKGATSINAYRLSDVCFLKRKVIKNPRFADQIVYYHANPLDKPCNEFERKEVG